MSVQSSFAEPPLGLRAQPANRFIQMLSVCSGMRATLLLLADKRHAACIAHPSKGTSPHLCHCRCSLSYNVRKCWHCCEPGKVVGIVFESCCLRQACFYTGVTLLSTIGGLAHPPLTRTLPLSRLPSHPTFRSEMQVCVISGESGAGKTESAKLFIKHVIHLSQFSSSGTSEGGGADASGTGQGLEDKIIQLNPLLEAFGNAQTLMNDNSSRFGKFIEIRFNTSAAITGATMKEYLLEKSRIMDQSDGERNFHIFYLLLSGVSDRLEEFQLGHVDDHALHRVIDGSDEAVDGIGNAKNMAMYEELMECFTVVGFTKEEQEQLFHLLCGVIHLADLEFGGDEDDAYVVSQEDQLIKVSTQLGVDAEPLQEGMLKMTTVTRGETIERKFKQAEAEDGPLHQFSKPNALTHA